MLGSNGGKIFVIHSTGDHILRLSALSFNFGTPRIGFHGAEGNTRDELKDVVESVNARGNVSAVHDYHYEKWTIQQYHELSTKK